MTGSGGIPRAPVLARSPLSWLAVFGPGAVVASLTIGTGELVFSARAGSLFGFEVLWLFLLTCILKWILLYSAARHIVLSGVHPVERYAALPGPRAWFPLVLLLLAAAAFPIWVGFVAGVLGTLLESQLGLDSHLWGVGATALAVALVLRGGYETLERVQLAVVAALLAAVTGSLLLLEVDWAAAARGLLLPGPLRYPAWLPAAAPELTARPVWLEAATYVGVIGGSGYDYLAYVAFLRHKRWGLSARPTQSAALGGLAQEQGEALRGWLLAPLVDTVISFAVVLIFSGVFVASGAIVLAPRHQIPAGGDLLTLQAQFVTTLHPALLPLYVVGALLAIAGTLYGTIAVAPAVLGEIVDALRQRAIAERPPWVDRMIVLWSGCGGVAVLAWSYLYRLRGGAGAHPPTLVEIVTPANLFTGVVACGCICLLNPWQDRRFLPRPLRMPAALAALNALAGIFFLGLGLRGYWDFGSQRFPEAGGGWLGSLVLLATLLFGWLAAWVLGRLQTPGKLRDR